MKIPLWNSFISQIFMKMGVPLEESNSWVSPVSWYYCQMQIKVFILFVHDIPGNFLYNAGQDSILKLAYSNFWENVYLDFNILCLG